VKSIFVVFCLLFSVSAWSNQLESIRIWPSPDNTRIVLDMGSAPAYDYFMLNDPHRLVVDLRQTQNRVNFASITNNSELITRIRDSKPPSPGSYRLVFELKSGVKPSLFPLTPAGEYGHRLVIDLPYQDQSRHPSRWHARRRRWGRRR
jgi:N-acetylmuramoyl-L-alanine amidase